MQVKLIAIRLFILMLAGSVIYLLLSRESPEISFEYDKFADYMVDAGFHTGPGQVDTDLLTHRTIVISGDINAAAAARVTKSLLLLNARDPQAPIHLYIRSSGGWVDDAFAIIDVMHSIAAPVNTHAVGSAGSSAAMILAAGTGTRFGYPNSLIMFHAGKYLDENSPYSLDVQDNERIQVFLRKYTHIPEKWLRCEEDTKLYLPADEAVEWGLIDQIRTK